MLAIALVSAASARGEAPAPSEGDYAANGGVNGAGEAINGIVIAPPRQALLAPAFTPMANGVAPGLSAGLSTVFTPDRARALECLTMAIAYEAGNQPISGQQAVGQVILNRVRAGRFQNSVCGVVFAGSARLTGCQFTFTCDGSLNRRLRDITWSTARSVATTVLAGEAPDRVGGATHYHADYVLPYWASSGTPTSKIGAHIFYRMPGDAATATPPIVAYGAEPDFIPVQKQRQRRRPAAFVPVYAPAATRPMFAPWGLPAGGMQAR